jgi:hypothetical protein
MYHVDYNGIPLKAAIDGVAGDYLWDIKTTDDASAAGMLKAIRNYRYNLQAYWYRIVYELATGRRPLGFRFLFVEKEPPYATAVCEIGPELMSWAVSDFEKAISLYRECSASGVWPERASSISRWRNSGGYAGRVLPGIVDSSSPKGRVSTKPGQLQCTTRRSTARSRRHRGW